MEKYISILKKGQVLSIHQLLEVCATVTPLLLAEANVVALSAPVAVCGDLHGQFYDLIRLFELNGTDFGSSSSCSYCFLGDYVDRGCMSVEVISLLLCLKVAYPRAITLIRGNHECRQITQVYGFYTECEKKYQGDARAWRSIMQVFDCLPLAASIEGRLLCLHGGLSPALATLDQLRLLPRFQEIPPDGAFSDLVWSDPDPKNAGFHVSPRGAGYMFGQDIVEMFLHRNKLEHISRAHQLCMEGYQVLFDDTFTTVWSAPNYCHRFGNLASVMLVQPDLTRTFNVFKEASTSTASESNAVVGPTTSSTNDEAVDLGYFT